MEKVYLKGPYETKINQHGRPRCMINKCHKHKKTKMFNGYQFCTNHINEIEESKIEVIYEPYPTTLVSGGDTIEEQSCHAAECNINEGLTMRYRGFFCKKHLSSLTNIRSNLATSIENKDYYSELYWRKQEKQFRKYPDLAHIMYINRMEKLIS